MRHFVIGTAGHVDHGKTSLALALTGVDTDRLPEEKRRGITIELGFAPWDLGGGVHASLIDVPGHRRLVHTMIAGAIGMELVLLVVAADEGVMPQTREHVAACELLGIRRAVVAVTKLDRAGEELARLAGDEALELLGARFEASMVLCSSKTGEGIDALREAVRGALARLAPREPSRRARLSVDRGFSVKGSGTVVTGTLVEGRIATSAPLFLVGPAGASETVARGLHVHNSSVSVAEAPTRLAVNLGGVRLEDVRRGDVLTDDPSARATRALDVALRAVGSASPAAQAGPVLKSGQTVHVYLGTARSPAKFELFGEANTSVDRDASNASTALGRLRLSKPLVALGGDRFVLRGSDVDGPAGAVLGGGVVLDADPPRRKARKLRSGVSPRLAALQALEAHDPTALLRALVLEAAPRMTPVSGLASRFSIEERELRRVADQLVAKSEITPILGREGSGKARLVGFASPAALTEAAEHARRLVAEHHQKAPLDRGLALETLRQKLAARAGVEITEEAIRLAARPTSGNEGRVGKKKSADASTSIVVEGDVARLTTFEGALASGAVAAAYEATKAALREAELKGLTEHAALVASNASAREVKAIFAKLVRDGHAVHTGDLWFWREAFDALRARVEAHLAAAPVLTIAEFKALSGLGRRQAILLLEQLDREGTTKRQGDDRVKG